MSLHEPLSDSAVRRFERKRGQLRATIEGLSQEAAAWKQRRKEMPHHLGVKELPETERFSRLTTERKHFVDAVKLISYRAEASMALLLRDHLARHDDAHALPRQIYTMEVDLLPDLEAKTLAARLDRFTQAARDEAARHLCEELNATEGIFPGTEPRLVHQVGSNHVPRDPEVQPCRPARRPVGWILNPCACHNTPSRARPGRASREDRKPI